MAKGVCLALVKTVCVAMMLISLGLGPSLVQSIGWVTMLQTHWQDSGSIDVALEMTFGGEHPCAFCKAAAHLAEQQAMTESPDEPGRPLEAMPKASKDLFGGETQTVKVFPPKEHFVPLIATTAPVLITRGIAPETPPPEVECRIS